MRANKMTDNIELQLEQNAIKIANLYGYKLDFKFGTFKQHQTDSTVSTVEYLQSFNGLMPLMCIINKRDNELTMDISESHVHLIDFFYEPTPKSIVKCFDKNDVDMFILAIQCILIEALKLDTDPERNAILRKYFQLNLDA